MLPHCFVFPIFCALFDLIGMLEWVFRGKTEYKGLSLYEKANFVLKALSSSQGVHVWCVKSAVSESISPKWLSPDCFSTLYYSTTAAVFDRVKTACVELCHLFVRYQGKIASVKCHIINQLSNNNNVVSIRWAGCHKHFFHTYPVWNMTQSFCPSTHLTLITNGSCRKRKIWSKLSDVIYFWGLYH